MVYLRLAVRWIRKLLMWGGMASMAWGVFSCDEFCEEPNRTAVVVNIYDSTTNALSNKFKITITGIENDSVLYSQVTNSQVMLPVNPSAGFMSFSFKNDTFPVDTIIIRYSRYNGFISSECGCVTYAEIQGEPERTDNTIMNLVVANPHVTAVSYRQGVINEENIRIYY